MSEQDYAFVSKTIVCQFSHKLFLKREHELRAKKKDYNGTWYCDECGSFKPVNGKHVYSCDRCGYDLCIDHFNKRLKAASRKKLYSNDENKVDDGGESDEYYDNSGPSDSESEDEVAESEENGSQQGGDGDNDDNDKEDDESKYKLHHACKDGNIRKIKKLLRQEWNVNELNGDKKTPLYVAWEERDDARLIRFLLNLGACCGNYQTPKIETKESKTDEESINPNDYNELTLGSDYKPEGNSGGGLKTMLHIECEKYNDISIVKDLIKNGSDPTIQDQNGYTCVKYAVQRGKIIYTQFLCYVLTIKVKNVTEMIKLVNVDKMLSIAIQKGFGQLIEFLTVLRDTLTSVDASLDKVRNCIVSVSSPVIYGHNSVVYKKYLHLQQQSKQCIIMSQQLSRDMKNDICDAVYKCLKLRMPMSDDWLMFSLYYLTRDNIVELEKKRYQKFSNLLKKTTNEFISNENSLHKRDHLWFKQYLLSSSIWYLTYKNKLIYDRVVNKSVNNETEMKQLFVKEFIINYSSKEDKYWKELTKLTSTSDMLVKNNVFNYSEHELRQDYISNGINIAPVFNRRNKKFRTSLNKFDYSKEFEYNIYLGQLLARACRLNQEFQQDMSRLFSENQIILSGKYFAGSLKTYDECVEDIDKIYVNKPFPRSAFLIDIVRGTVVFDSIKSMLRCMEDFIALISGDSNDGGVGCIKQIVRLTNDYEIFKDRKISRMGDSKFKYCDITMNIIIEHEGQAMIGEIKFLTQEMSECKTRFENLRLIETQKTFMTDVINIAQNNKNSPIDSYFIRCDPSLMIIRRDYWQFCNQILINETRLMNYPEYPILYLLLKAQWNEGIELFYDAIKHYNSIKMSRKVKNEFQKKYLNHPLLKEFAKHAMFKR